MSFYLGIDIGTSATKAVCFDEKGKVMCESSFEYELLTPAPAFAEQRPDDWVEAVKKAIKSITSKGYSIRGIGLSGQMHGLVLVDKENHILRNSIIWCDNRAMEETKIIEQTLKNRTKEITGNDPVASFTLAKLLWVKRHEPDIFSKIDKMFLPKDYIRYVLTGKFQTEYSDASGTQMLDLKQRVFSKEILDAFDIPFNILPELIESVQISGNVRKELCQELQLDESCFVVGGAGDQAAAAVGNGILKKGDVSVVLGSSGVVFSPIDSADIAQNTLQVFCHAVPNTFHIMGVTNGCGLSYKWYKEYINEDRAETLSYEDLNRKAQAIAPGANGVIFLPYLNGERTPHLDPYASGTFIGIRQNTSNGMLVRAVLEGICFSLKDCFKLLPGLPCHISVSGGGSKGELWRTILASVLGCDIWRNRRDEGGALGVAILAMVAAKEYKSIEDACHQILGEADVTISIKTWESIYERIYPLYQQAYLSLKSLYYEIYHAQEEQRDERVL